MSDKRKGLLYALGAYLLWGVISLFWKQLAGIDAYQTFSYRIISTLLTMVLYMVLSGSRARYAKELTQLWSNKQELLQMVLASVFISINWLTYIYGVTNGQATEASLGYYLMPIVSVTLSVLVLRERLSLISKVAVGLASLAVFYLLFQTGRLPAVTMILSFSFAIYGLIKKGVHLSSDVAMLVEAAIITPIVIVYLIFFVQETPMDYSLTQNVLLALSGVITAIPLLLFAEGVKRAPLNQVGFIQYINPTIQLAIAIMVFGESINGSQLTAFILIWIAVAIFIFGQVLELKKSLNRF